MNVEEVNEPFLPKYNDDEPEILEGFQEKYVVEYRGELLTIDSNDWRKSGLLKGQIISTFMVFVLFGLGDQTIGALIPIFQKEYHVNDVQTSFLFLSSITGYILMGILNGYTHEKIGIRGILCVGSSCMLFAYVVFGLAPPFWVLVLVAVFSGIGCGILDAACNAWITLLVDSNQILGILHGCYGLGCLISPSLISSLLERKKDPWKWYQYYHLLALYALISGIVVIFFFRNETATKHRYNLDLRMGKIDRYGNETTNLDDDQVFEEASVFDALRSKIVWTFAIILFLYVGGEVAFGSWLISYLLRISKLQYKLSAHIATTFWSGLMVGRTALGFVTAHYFKNELNANFVYMAASVAGFAIFYAISVTNWIWLYFVITFITGAAIGPIFPTTIVSATGVLPPTYHTSGIGFICAFGGGGAAGLPFLIGLLANSSKTGLALFPLIILIIYAILLAMWLVIVVRFRDSYSK